MNQYKDEETAFFELLLSLWEGKWLISAFVAIAILLGGTFLFIKEKVYHSKLIYSVDTIPPFFNNAKASTDFQKKFYSKDIFEDWKKSNVNVSLIFEDFSATEVVNGFIFSKEDDDQLATLEFEKRGESFVLVRSNQSPILDDFFRYANFVNELLKKEYVVRANEELKIIESRFKDLASVDSSIIQTVLTTDRYIVSAEKGANVLSIERPTKPKKISPKTSLILALSIVLGGFLGVIFITIRNTIKNKKS